MAVAVTKDGLSYEVTQTDGSKLNINFIHKTEDGFVNGLTNEDLVLILKNRFRYLGDKHDSRCNVQCEVYINQIHLQLVQREDHKTKKYNKDKSGS